jgi:colanic acid biosynthesis glycosyl transferase WcaI
MRLTLINQFYTPDISPTAHLCASVAEHRAAMGDRVTVIAGRGGYIAPVAAAQGRAVHVIRLWTSQLGSGSFLRRLFDWVTFHVTAMFQAMILQEQDVIICMTTPPYIALAGVMQKIIHPGTKLVLWNMDCYPEAVERTGIIRPGGMLSRIMRAMNRAIFRRLDHLVCLDAAMKDLLLSQYSPRDETLACSVIPNWETAACSSPVQNVPVWNSPIVEMLRGRYVILYLGNAGYGHEFKTMLDAADELRSEPVIFLFVGGGALRPWIAEQAKARGLENIILCDYVPKEKTPEVLGVADCALITLESEMAGVMSPSKLHSNLAAGLPILYIGPKGSNVDEAIDRFGCGVSVRPGDANRVAQFVRERMKDPKGNLTLRRLARQAFDEAYCDRVTLPQFDEMFLVVERRLRWQ